MNFIIMQDGTTVMPEHVRV